MVHHARPEPRAIALDDRSQGCRPPRGFLGNRNVVIYSGMCLADARLPGSRRPGLLFLLAVVILDLFDQAEI